MYQDILTAQDLVKKQEYDKAAKIYKKIIQNKTSKTILLKINFQLAEIYSIYLNKPKESLLYYKKVIDLSDDPLWQVKSLEKIANIYNESLNDPTMAAKHYRTLINFKPELNKIDEYKFAYAKALLKSSNYKVSLKILDQLTTSSKKTEILTLSFYYQGLIHFYNSNWNKAINSWFEYLKRETRRDKVVNVKFMIANAYESSEKLKQAYNIYYSILGEYPNPKIIKSRLNSLYDRRVFRKRWERKIWSY